MDRWLNAAVIVIALVAGGGHPLEARTSVALANLAACRANLKTLAGALELMEGSEEPGLAVVVVQRFGAEDQARLVSAGYLGNVAVCPGAPPEGGETYVLVPGSARVACLLHGFLEGTGTPREQMVQRGVTDPEILASASDEPLPRPEPGPDRRGRNLLETIVLVVVVTLADTLARGRKARLSMAEWLAVLILVVSFWSAARHQDPGTAHLAILVSSGCLWGARALGAATILWLLVRRVRAARGTPA